MILSWGDVVSSIAGLQVFIGSCAQSDLFPGLDGRRYLGIAIPSLWGRSGGTGGPGMPDDRVTTLVPPRVLTIASQHQDDPMRFVQPGLRRLYQQLIWGLFGTRPHRRDWARPIVARERRGRHACQAIEGSSPYGQLAAG